MKPSTDGVTNETVIGRCERCGTHAHLAHVRFHQSIGLVVIRLGRIEQGWMCRRCVGSVFSRTTTTTALLGWWGVISFFVTLATIPMNVATWLRARSLPAAPVPESGSPRALPVVDSAARSFPLDWLALVGVTMALFPIAIWSAFFHAPVEATMGLSQKIFYFHVPSAYAMYVGFGLCAIASGVYVFSRKDLADALAVAGAEVGLIFCFIVLITGPLWGRKAWGVYWTWDPRLTTTLLAAMIFCAYVVLRSFGTGAAEKLFAGVLAIVGLFMLPLIHYSVQQWRGQHPTVITSRGGGLDASMLHALLINLAFFSALVALLIWTRVRIERSRQRYQELELEATERGLLEDA